MSSDYPRGTFGFYAYDRPNIWVVCHACRRGMFLFADHPMIAHRDVETTQFKCQVCGALVSKSFMDPRGGADPNSWTVMDMNGPEPQPMAPLTETEFALARNGCAIRRPRDPDRIEFR